MASRVVAIDGAAQIFRADLGPLTLIVRHKAHVKSRPAVFVNLLLNMDVVYCCDHKITKVRLYVGL
jgi:hypothetical protein